MFTLFFIWAAVNINAKGFLADELSRSEGAVIFPFKKNYFYDFFILNIQNFLYFRCLKTIIFKNCKHNFYIV